MNYDQTFGWNEIIFSGIEHCNSIEIGAGGWVRVNVAIFRKQPKKGPIIFKGFLPACFDRIKRKMLCWPEGAPSKQISQKFIADY